MDIKAKITEIIDKIKNDPTLLASFKDDPVKAIEGIIGTDLPDEQIKAVIDGVKEKINIGDLLGGAGDTISNVASSVTGAISGAADDATDSIGDKVKDVVGGLGEKLGGLFKKD